MGITVGVGLEVEERLSLLSRGGEAPRFITLERRWERNDGGALVALLLVRIDQQHRSRHHRTAALVALGHLLVRSFSVRAPVGG